jgi:hypothetical protein
LKVEIAVLVGKVLFELNGYTRPDVMGQFEGGCACILIDL